MLIEDSCDTMTHTPETDISVVSFYASHVITAGGSGGMLMVNTIEKKNVALQYRDWGRMGTNVEDMSERFGHSVDGIEYDFKFLYSVAGYNFKSSEMNAAFGLAQMKKLDTFLAIRRKNTERYRLTRMHTHTAQNKQEAYSSITRSVHSSYASMHRAPASYHCNAFMSTICNLHLWLP